MAMRAPGFDGADGTHSDGEGQCIPDDDPVLLSILTAPLDDEPETEGERLALEEWRANPRGTPAAVISTEVAERIARRA
jgi:hypothetical protein